MGNKIIDDIVRDVVQDVKRDAAKAAAGTIVDVAGKAGGVLGKLPGRLGEISRTVRESMENSLREEFPNSSFLVIEEGKKTPGGLFSPAVTKYSFSNLAGMPMYTAELQSGRQCGAVLRSLEGYEIGKIEDIRMDRRQSLFNIYLEGAFLGELTREDLSTEAYHFRFGTWIIQEITPQSIQILNESGEIVADILSRLRGLLIRYDNNVKGSDIALMYLAVLAYHNRYTRG